MLSLANKTGGVTAAFLLASLLSAQSQDQAGDDEIRRALEDARSAAKESQIRGVRILAQVQDLETAKRLALAAGIGATLGSDDPEVLDAAAQGLVSCVDRDGALAAVGTRLHDLRVALTKATKPSWPQMPSEDLLGLKDVRPFPPLDGKKKSQQQYEAALRKWEQRDKKRRDRREAEQLKREKQLATAQAADESQALAAERLVGLAARLRGFDPALVVDELVRTTECLLVHRPTSAAPMMPVLCSTHDRRAIQTCASVLTRGDRDVLSVSFHEACQRRLAAVDLRLINTDWKSKVSLPFVLSDEELDAAAAPTLNLARQAYHALQAVGARLDTPAPPADILGPAPPAEPTGISAVRALALLEGQTAAWSEWLQTVSSKLR